MIEYGSAYDTNSPQNATPGCQGAIWRIRFHYPSTYHLTIIPPFEKGLGAPQIPHIRGKAMKDKRTFREIRKDYQWQYPVHEHPQRIFGALTPCCGAWAPGLCTIASSASGASRAPRGHRPRSLPPGRPNNSNSGRNWGVFSRNYGASGALTPAFWDSGVRAPSVRTVAF